MSSATFWLFSSKYRYCRSSVIATNSSVGSCSEREQGGQTTPSWNALTVLECEQFRADSRCQQHNTERQHSTRLVLNGSMSSLRVSQYTSHVIVILYCMNSTIRTPFLSYKTDFFSFWQQDNNCLNFCGFDCCLISKFASETLVLSPVNRTMWLRKSSACS
jgi:hypothetical protein